MFKVWNKDDVGSMTMKTQPGSAVQGRAFSIQPEVQLLDLYRNPIEKTTETIDVKVELVTGGGCPADSCSSTCDGSSIQGVCFKFFQEQSSRSEAQQSCQTWGGYLATVSNEAQNKLVSALTQGITSWIGLKRDEFTDSAWYWDQQGQSLTLSAHERDATYLNWLGWMQDYPGMCAVIHAGNEDEFSQWGPENCASKIPFVCSKMMQATGSTCHCCQRLLGNTVIEAQQGVAQFTDLYTHAYPGSAMQLHFTAFFRTRGITADTTLMVTSETFQIYERTSQIVVLASLRRCLRKCSLGSKNRSGPVFPITAKISLG